MMSRAMIYAPSYHPSTNMMTHCDASESERVLSVGTPYSGIGDVGDAVGFMDLSQQRWLVEAPVEWEVGALETQPIIVHDVEGLYIEDCPILHARRADGSSTSAAVVQAH